jgi:hypothetical protein
MIDDRQLKDYVDGALSESEREGLEASLPFDKVAQRVLANQLRIHHALQTLDRGTLERARLRLDILDELGLLDQKASPGKSRPTAPPIESVFRPPHPKRRRLPLACILAAGVALVILLIFLRWIPKPEIPKVGHLFRMRGDVSVVRNGNTLPHRDGLLLSAMDVLTLGGDSKCGIRLNDGSEIDIVGPAVFVPRMIERGAESAIFLQLDLGEILVSIPAQLSQPATLNTPHAILASSGGSFRLQVDSRRTRATVKHGTLKVIDGSGTTHTLQPGDSFSSKPTDGFVNISRPIRGTAVAGR